MAVHDKISSREALLSTQIILEHLFTVKSHAPKHFLRVAPTRFAFTRCPYRSAHNRTFVGNRGGTKTRIALEAGVHSHDTRNSNAVPRLLHSLTQHALLYRLFVAHNTTWNSIAQT